MTADNNIQEEYSTEEVALPNYEDPLTKDEAYADPLPSSSSYSSDHKKSTLISGIICLITFLLWAVLYLVWVILVYTTLDEDVRYIIVFFVAAALFLYSIFKVIAVILGIIGSVKSSAILIIICLVYVAITGVLETTLLCFLFVAWIADFIHVWWFFLIWGGTELSGLIFFIFATRRTIYLFRNKASHNHVTVVYEMTPQQVV